MIRKNQEENDTGYEELFIRFSRQVEKAGAVLLVVFLAGLIISQALLRIPEVRERLVKVERLEGQPYRQGAKP
ncbi:hypothetical protein [Paenibacillus puerhi]|uniref:hypothetical protein n=1 Tax=Paenibacillus puerhi TaxID=2692622 RepID=UPI00135A7178|nr:hypothetical protein [Paenibacillus puerhi]